MRPLLGATSGQVQVTESVRLRSGVVCRLHRDSSSRGSDVAWCCEV